MYITFSKIFLLILFFLSFVNSQNGFVYTTQCISTSYFDISSLSCVECGTNKVVDETGYGCKCKSGYTTLVDSLNRFEFSCSSCAQSSSTDRSSCQGCDGGTNSVFNSENGDCQCQDDNYFLIERDGSEVLLANKQCIQCPTDTYSYITDPYSCITCSDIDKEPDIGGTCVCKSGLTSYYSMCISTDESLFVSQYSSTTASVVHYRDVQTIDGGEKVDHSITSYYILNYFPEYSLKCKYRKDNTACQALANLCVLTMYDEDNTVCKLILDLMAERTLSSHGFTGWQETLPWLWYPNDNILDANPFNFFVTLSDANQDDHIHTLSYYIAQYSLNGTYIGKFSLTSQIQLCLNNPLLMLSFNRIGTSFENQCEINLKEILQYSEMYFYDLYVENQDKLYPVPVKVLNLRKNNKYPNLNENLEEQTVKGEMVVVRRFFLYDNIMGKESQDVPPSFITYAKSITLRVTMMLDSTDKIYPPLLIIQYGQRSLSSLTSLEPTQYKSNVGFTSEYIQGYSNFWIGIIVLFVLSLILMLGILFFRITIYQKHNMIQECSCNMLIGLLIFIMGIVSDVMFWLMFIISVFCFISFKGQAVIYFLLPALNDSLIYTFSALLWIVFIGKLLWVLLQLFQQTTVSIFFIDWEQSLQENVNPDPNKPQGVSSNVSVWRKLFVANEWNELQTEQIINYEIGLLVMLFLSQGLGLDYLASAHPDMSLEPSFAIFHPILSFSVSTFFWLLICFLQYIFIRKIYYFYYQHKASSFIDLLELSNISCLVLDSPYHGYYLHGKTVHQKADVSLRELNELLYRERNAESPLRGLPGGTNDNQTCYEIFINQPFNHHYMKIHNQSIVGDNTLDRHNLQENLSPNQLMIPPSVLDASDELNTFLKSFFKKTNPKFKYERMQRTYFENVCTAFPAIDNNNSLLYDDDQFRFTSTILMGMEYEWTLILIILYNFIQYYSNNNFVSTCVTFIIHYLFRWARGYWGKINLAAKTLVDDRFLL